MDDLADEVLIATSLQIVGETDERIKAQGWEHGEARRLLSSATMALAGAVAVLHQRTAALEAEIQRMKGDGR